MVSAEGLWGPGPVLWHPQNGPWEAGKKWQAPSVQLEWPEVSGQPRPPPHLSASHSGPSSPGMGGDRGAESLWGPGWWLGPPPLLRPQLGTPYWLGFSPKKGRKEAAGRPCPAPRTQGWGDRETREGSPAPKQKPVLLRLPEPSRRYEAPIPGGHPLQDSHSRSGPKGLQNGGGGPGTAGCPVWGLSPTVTVRTSCATAAVSPAWSGLG